MTPYRDPDERFWEKVDVNEDGCWLWKGSCNPKGYGWFNAGRDEGGKIVFAHGWAYRRYVGEVPEGMLLDHRHTCPKRCACPTHLRLVTPKQNEENRSGPTRANVSGYRGVAWISRSRRYRATVRVDGKIMNLGEYDDPAEAGEVAKAARLRYYTHNDADRGTHDLVVGR